MNAPTTSQQQVTESHCENALEFEAVFFVGVDGLAARDPDLFDKYLYVGATRAATYLGMTCAETLPNAMKGMLSVFAKDWA